MENLFAIPIGIILIIIGCLNRRGNISMIHSYHRKRVTEENVLPFGRLVGLGTIIIGISVILCGILTAVAMFTGTAVLTTVGYIIIGVGLAVGLVISFAAMIKYNKGIF